MRPSVQISPIEPSIPVKQKQQDSLAIAQVILSGISILLAIINLSMGISIPSLIVTTSSMAVSMIGMTSGIVGATAFRQIDPSRRLITAHFVLSIIAIMADATQLILFGVHVPSLHQLTDRLRMGIIVVMWIQAVILLALFVCCYVSAVMIGTNWCMPVDKTIKMEIEAPQTSQVADGQKNVSGRQLVIPIPLPNDSLPANPIPIDYAHRHLATIPEAYLSLSDSSGEGDQLTIKIDIGEPKSPPVEETKL